MAELSYSTVKQFADEHDWEVVDEYQMGGTDWSVTAMFDSFRISIDIPRTNPRLNNIFIDGPRFSVANVEEFTEFCDRLPERWDYRLETDNTEIAPYRIQRATNRDSTDGVETLLDDGVELFFVPIIESHSGEICLDTVSIQVQELQSSFKK